MRPTRATLLLLCLCTFLLGLGAPAITDSDEAFYAEASREMVESGDWLTPRFNYEDRWQKPILYYWLTAATYLVTGPTEFAARLWSALSGIALALLTWSAARHVSGDERAAWTAGAIAATCFGYFAIARAALPDLPLTFCITLTVWSGLRALDSSVRRSGSGIRDPAFGMQDAGSRIPGRGSRVASPASRTPSRGWCAVAGAAAALGFLLKGPVALVIPAIVLLPIAWRERARATLRPADIATAAVVFALIGLPWYVAMFSAHGTAYAQSFFIGDNLERFATDRFNDPRPVWFYLPVLVGGLFPWSAYLLALPARPLAAVFRKARAVTDQEWRLLLWAAMPIVFYTISVGKQPRYVLPVLPPIAVLLASALAARVSHARAARSGQTTLAGATWATAALLAAGGLLLVRLQQTGIAASALATLLGATALAVAALVLAAIAMRQAWHGLPAALALAGTALLLSVEYSILARGRPEPVEVMAALVGRHRGAHDRVGAYRVFVRNLVFYTGVKQDDLFDETRAIQFAQSPDRVLLVLPEDERATIESRSGVRLRALGEVSYVNTANIRLGTLLRADPEGVTERVLLVTNR